jgi:hypothetical protein
MTRIGTHRITPKEYPERNIGEELTDTERSKDYDEC